MPSKSKTVRRRATSAPKSKPTRTRAKVPDSAQRPTTPAELRAWLQQTLGIEAAPTPLLQGSCSPFDYLCSAFFESSAFPQASSRPGRVAVETPQALLPSPDLVVLASRGAGKTFYAAVATVLDLIFKPGIDIKILGGSLEQSLRMHEHLRRFFEIPILAAQLDRPITARRILLTSGSRADVLAQSHTSIRGVRPQKLRCDEVELFDPDVWRAAQLTTRSKRCADINVRGSIEALSTMHRPGGLMATLISDAAPFLSQASSRNPSSPQALSPRTLFRWTAIDTLEHCPESRHCKTCPIHDECQGRAKRPLELAGHFIIDDAIAMKQRSDRQSWESEMLCLRPIRTSAVFPEFDPAIHIFNSPPLIPDPRSLIPLCAIDFGLRTAAVLWATLDESSILRIIAERITSNALLDSHISAIQSGNPSFPEPQTLNPAPLLPRFIAVDPAGAARSDQTGLSPVTVLRQSGFVIRHGRTPLADGLSAVRARLKSAAGTPTLFIHARCARLIEALQNYRYPDDPRAAAPMKDGTHDHPVDALRYLVTNIEARHSFSEGRYA